jgi:hypothetical protein
MFGVLISTISPILPLLIVSLRVLDVLFSFYKNQVLKRKIKKIHMKYSDIEGMWYGKTEMKFRNDLVSIHFEEKSKKVMVSTFTQKYSTEIKFEYTMESSQYEDWIKVFSENYSKVEKITLQDKVALKYLCSLKDSCVEKPIDTQKSYLTNTETLTLKLLKEKTASNSKTYTIGFITFGAIVLYQIIAISLEWSVMNQLVLYFSAFFILLCYTKQKLFEYRVKKGFYGTCYSEAKELVKFIVEQNNQNKGNKGKPVFIDEEIEAYALSVLKGAKSCNA